MKQNQKGITIVGLLITVIVIVTIAGVCIYTGRDILEEAKLEQLKTNMLLIQAKCHSIQDKVTANELKPEDYKGDKINDTDFLSDDDYSKYLITKSDDDKWRSLTADNIKNDIGLGEIAVNNGDYLVNYNDGEVIYTPGYNGKYTLTQILESDAE